MVRGRYFDEDNDDDEYKNDILSMTIVMVMMLAMIVITVCMVCRSSVIPYQ